MTENTPKYQGVIVYNMNDIPLGFGATAFSTDECKALDPTRIVVFHQADLGEVIIYSIFLDQYCILNIY